MAMASISVLTPKTIDFIDLLDIYDKMLHLLHCDREIGKVSNFFKPDKSHLIAIR